MADYRTPGVYIEEISQSSPTASTVQTAIPVFIGHTEKAVKNGSDLTFSPTFVNSLLEYKEAFGGGYKHKNIEVVLNENGTIADVEFEKDYYLFKSVQMFFANGGGRCVIVPVGDYTQEITLENLSRGLQLSKKEDTITIILLPDAMLLPRKEEAYALQQEALAMCQKLKDRVLVLDLFEEDNQEEMDATVENFRNGIGMNHLQYGAAYYPRLQTIYHTEVSLRNVSFKDNKGKAIDLSDLSPNPQLVTSFRDALSDFAGLRKFVKDPLGKGKALTDEAFSDASGKKSEVIQALKTIKSAGQQLYAVRSGLKNSIVINDTKQKTNKNSVFGTVVRSAAAIDQAISGGVFDLKKDFDDLDLGETKPLKDLVGLKEESRIAEVSRPKLEGLVNNLEKSFQNLVSDARTIEVQLDKNIFERTPIYKTAVSNIYKASAMLPPSGAIAGIYAQVDDTRGVSKAPANVSINAIVKPATEIDSDQQGDLNVDYVSGKSINAIVSFPRRGNLVWGARTLAGNDSEWRFISVRRFFNFAEKTLKESSAWAVFESNNELTWIRLRAVMNNFLTNTWKAGALVGSTPDEAFFIKVGLGETMTQEDIIEGKLIIEVGMAVVRPAEFIIIKFSHKTSGPEAEGGEEEGEEEGGGEE